MYTIGIITGIVFYLGCIYLYFLLDRMVTMLGQIDERLDEMRIDLIIKKAKEANQASTDLFESGSVLNDYFSIQDKIDFILSIYEVAYVDNNFDFLERHVITQILNIFNLDKSKIKEKDSS